MFGRDSRKETEQFFAQVFQAADAREARNRRAAEGQAYGSREWFAALFDESPAPPASAQAAGSGGLVAAREGAAPLGPGAGTILGGPDGVRGLAGMLAAEQGEGPERDKGVALSRNIAVAGR